MTVVVALKDEVNKKIYLGADKLFTSIDISYDDLGCKLLKMEIPVSNDEIDEIYVGFSGNFWLYQYLLNVFQAPIYNIETNFMNYLYRCFFKELRNELKNQNLIEKDKEVFDADLGLIIIHKDEIYEISGDFSIVKLDKPYCVEGCGYKMAVPVIENLLEFHNDMDYKEIVSEALYTAGKLNIYCNTDNDILTIEY